MQNNSIFLIWGIVICMNELWLFVLQFLNLTKINRQAVRVLIYLKKLYELLRFNCPKIAFLFFSSYGLSILGSINKPYFQLTQFNY